MNDIVYWLPAFLVGIVLHEWAHAYVAWKMGDPTGRNLGRLSLNPLVHIDPIGFLAMFVVGIGWAKPVPIVSQNFRNPRSGVALSAGAGPLMNLLVATASILAINLMPAYQRDPMLMRSGFSWFQLLYVMAQVNALLAVFNLIPVKPLDGHHFLEVLLPPRAFFRYKQNEAAITVVALVALFMGAFNPLFRLVRTAVASVTVTSYWGV